MTQTRSRAKITSFFDDYDVLITPTLAQSGPESAQWHKRGWFANLVSNIRYAPYQATFNLLDWSDAQSVTDKIALAKALGVRGVALFEFDGGEDQAIWSVLQGVKK